MRVRGVIYGIILVWLAYTPGVVFGQSDCESVFQKAIDQVRSLRLLSRNNGFEMNCRIIVTPEKGSAVEDKLSVCSLKDKYKCVTGQYSLYQDASTMVVIQRDEKTVFITRPLPEKQRQDQFTRMIELQDSLQKHLTIKGCSREFGAVHRDKGYMKIDFIPESKLSRLGLKSITYWVELEHYEVHKISIEYIPGSGYGMKRYEMIIDTLNARSVTVPFKGTALSQVLKGDKVRSELKGYQLQDSRK